MALGLCCQWIEPRQKRDGTVVYENIIDEQPLQVGQFKAKKYSDDRIHSTYINNVEQIIQLMPKLVENKIKCFRLSSGILPLFEFNESLAKNSSLLSNRFKTLGELFLKNGIRVTTHPGQFVVLSSDKPQVVTNSIGDLVYHAWMFDQMGLPVNPFYSINIHGGKSGGASRLIDTIKRLPSSVKGRLTLENDELCYSVPELVEVSKQTGVPIVFDSHHHSINVDSTEEQEAFQKCVDTWKPYGCKPLQHVSNSIPGVEHKNVRELRKHSDYIQTIPKCQLIALKTGKIDLEVEAKMKNLAILKLRRDFSYEG